MSMIPIYCGDVSVVLLRESGGGHEVLLLRRTRRLPGCWCEVAGGIESGEAAWQAALRETREETGLVLDRLYSADHCFQYYEPNKERMVLLPVFVGYPKTGQQVRLNREHDAYRWMSFDDARAAVPFGSQRRMLAHIEEDFVKAPPSPWLQFDLAQ